MRARKRLFWPRACLSEPVWRATDRSARWAPGFEGLDPLRPPRVCVSSERWGGGSVGAGRVLCAVSARRCPCRTKSTATRPVKDGAVTVKAWACGGGGGGIVQASPGHNGQLPRCRARALTQSQSESTGPTFDLFTINDSRFRVGSLSLVSGPKDCSDLSTVINTKFRGSKTTLR